MPIEELEKLSMLPAEMITDNTFFYGESEIIGNLPIDESKIDYPIHYGWSYGREEFLACQYGKTYIERRDEKPISGGFARGGIGMCFGVELPILLECIEENSNAPFWYQPNFSMLIHDLRHPQNKEVLEKVKAQLGI